MTVTKDRKTNKVKFWENGQQVYPINVSGNIAEFANGEMIIL